MTGSNPPPDRELHARLRRRVLSVEGPEGLEKRYNRQGVPKQQTPKVSKAKSTTTKAPKGGSGGKQSNKAPAGKGATNAGASAAVKCADLPFFTPQFLKLLLAMGRQNSQRFLRGSPLPINQQETILLA